MFRGILLSFAERRIIEMEMMGELYYERGRKFFELEQYEQAIEDWVHAYELDYNKELILNNIYQCFVLPNDLEFKKNYEINNDGFTTVFYDECALDFIPVSEEKFYIYDKDKDRFQGTICLKETVLQGNKIEFNSILYTDTWDIRDIVSDMEKQLYGMVYLLLNELESKFVSFFKLPSFKELYMGKVVLFHDISSMNKFFLEHEKFYFPKKMITADSLKYADIMRHIQNEKNVGLNSETGRNLLFLKGQSQYGASRRMIEDMATSFQKVGYNTLVLDGLQESFGQQLMVASEKYKFDAVITFNAMFIETECIRKLGKKFCTIMGDHPLWHGERLRAADQNTIIWYGDQHDVDYVKRYYPNVGRVDLCFGSSTFLEGEKVYSNRKYDVVFTGGYSRPEIIYKQICETYSGVVLNVVKSFIEILVRCPDKTYEGALKETLDLYEVHDIEDADFIELAEEFCLVNKYVRAYFRDKIIRTIIQSGIKIHISGNGWEEFESEYRDNLIIEKNDWYTAKKMIANAKISLNIMPWFKAGLHDRSVTSLLSGAVLLTDSSEYIEKQFQDMENIAIFHLDKLDELPEKIKFLLSHEEVAREIAENGYNLAIKEYTWDIRVKQMDQILKEELNQQIEGTQEGHALLLDLEVTQREMSVKDVLIELQEIEEILDSFQSNEAVGLTDYQYYVNRLKNATCRIVSYFPDVEVGMYVWNIITNLHDPIPPYILELIRMQAAWLIKVITVDCLK